MANHITHIRDQYEADLANANRTRAIAIAKLSTTGTPQKDIIEGTGYSRETVRKLTAQGLSHIAAAPPTPTPDGTCSTACAEAHTYEGDCTVPPMLMPVINIHAHEDDTPTRFSWQCYQGGDCEGLVHLGYPTLPAARRGYDHHLRDEHLSVS